VITPESVKVGVAGGMGTGGGLGAVGAANGRCSPHALIASTSHSTAARRLMAGTSDLPFVRMACVAGIGDSFIR